MLILNQGSDGMGNKVGTSMVTLMDLNDAIISGTAPLNPTGGTLWIDDSGAKPVLKKWSNGVWVTQQMDLEDLDPQFTEYISRGVDAATLKLGNLSNDDKITAMERQVILDKLTDMLGASPSGTVPLPAVATVNGYTVGEYYQTRKSATDAGLSTSDTAYTGYATAYTTLSNYLNTILVDGIYPWDVSNAKADSVHTIVGQTFRDNWKAFYQAQLVLQTRTSKRVSDAKAEAEAYSNSYREQLVGNGYAGVASNRNFSGFTYTTAQKVTGPGSFSRTTTGETRTDEFIPVEADRTYRLMISVINSTTTGTHNLGLECYNAAGTSLGKRHILRSGTSNTLPSTTSFVHYEGVISGLNIGAGSVTDTDFPAGTTQVKIYFNTNIGTTTNTIYVADVSFALENIEANKDYNGISLSAAKGMVVTSTRNIAEFNATDGIKVYKKTDPANPVFKLDSTTGDLTVTGNINMTSGSITWANVGAPSASQVGAATPNDVSSAVSNIKVGGRNLILNSAKAVNTTTYLVTTYDLSKPIAQAMEVTISIKGTLGSGKESFGIYNSGGTVRPTTVGPSDLGTDGIYRKTFLWNIGGSPNNALHIYQIPITVTVASTIEWIKLEEGNKGTDWLPAPEDAINKLNDLYTLTNNVGGVTVIDANKIQTGTLDATKVNVNNLNATNITSGTVNVSRITLKGLTVNNGLTDTFKVDVSGNVSINGNLQAGTGSNIFTKTESGDMAVKANIIGVGAKYDYGTFTATATNKIYFHGYAFNTVTNDQQPADVDGYFYTYDNSTKITALKGVLDLTSGIPAGTEGYIIYDTTVNKWGFAVYDSAITAQTWRRYNVADSARHNIALTWTTNIYVMGELIL